MVFFLPIGALNALVNVGVWIIHALCCFLAAKMYAKVSSYEMSKNGRTACTDASDVSPEEWIFGRKFRRWRSLSWWAAVLLLVMVVLIPIELLLEAGIDESNKCRPEVLNSTGVCASSKDGGSNAEKLSAMIQVQNFEWGDKTWDFVPVGAAKSPKAKEVRIAAKRRSRNQSFLVNHCKVRTGVCSSCGYMTLKKKQSVFRTAVTDWSGIPRSVEEGKRGDLTNDKVDMTVFIFWDAGSVPDPSRAQFNGTRIRVRGIEMVLNKKEKKNATRAKHPLLLNPKRTRTYEIEYATDGLSPKHLADAVSIYRTAVLEHTGVKNTEIQEKISNLKPLDRTDVAKAAYAFRSERWADTCRGDVDVYTTCGTFKLFYVLPFVVMSAGIILATIVVHVLLRGVKTVVPHDAESWRQQAHILAQGTSASQDYLGSNNADQVYDPVLFDRTSVKPNADGSSDTTGSEIYISRAMEESNF